ncbi:hypothetical protein AOLI_G00164670 [Acnodon oligacanthus]
MFTFPFAACHRGVFPPSVSPRSRSVVPGSVRTGTPSGEFARLSRIRGSSCRRLQRTQRPEQENIDLLAVLRWLPPHLLSLTPHQAEALKLGWSRYQGRITDEVSGANAYGV